MIIAGFSGIGKTFFCNHVEGAKDFVCMPYKYLLPEIGSGEIEHEKLKADLSLEMNPEYPNNYINAILENMDKYKYLVIPSDSRVLAGLKDKHVPYILCFPEQKAKEEYRKRYLQRGNTEEFLDIFIGGWDYFMNSLRQDTYGARIVLDKGEYLLDVKEKIDEIIQASELPIRDNKVTGAINSYLIGSKIIDMFVLSKDSVGYCEGGLTIIFEKGNERGILVYGYYDLDEWITYLQIGNKVIHGRLGYFEYPYMVDKLIQEYHIGSNEI
ncbi:MAG TPA: hypothetical protein GXZ70_02725 [Clostridiales bacterium]|nr:hypothetical protein [Clostridiales bacterium]